MSMLRKRSAIVATLMFATVSPLVASHAVRAAVDEEAVAEVNLDDARIARVVSAATDQIIFNSKYAQRHARSQQVVDYADQLLRENQRMAEEFELVVKRVGLKPEESALSILCRIAGLRNLAALHLSSPEQFDQTYLSKSAKFQKRLAILLQERLIPEAQHQSVRTYLQNMQSELLGFVEQANQLNAELSD
jgi:predicted outer membrane protein